MRSGKGLLRPTTHTTSSETPHNKASYAPLQDSNVLYKTQLPPFPGKVRSDRALGSDEPVIVCRQTIGMERVTHWLYIPDVNIIFYSPPTSTSWRRTKTYQNLQNNPLVICFSFIYMDQQLVYVRDCKKDFLHLVFKEFFPIMGDRTFTRGHISNQASKPVASLHHTSMRAPCSAL
jgi:hypothetical protein